MILYTVCGTRSLTLSHSHTQQHTLHVHASLTRSHSHTQQQHTSCACFLLPLFTLTHQHSCLHVTHLCPDHNDPSVISHQPSVTSQQPSVISQQPSVISNHSSAKGHHASVVDVVRAPSACHAARAIMGHTSSLTHQSSVISQWRVTTSSVQH